MQTLKANADESTSAENAPPFPRLAVSDLLILTLAVSFSFACDAPDIHDGARQYDLSWRDYAPVLADTFVEGVLLFGLIVLARERFRGSRRPYAPGHWLLLALGPYSMWLLVLSVFLPILEADWNFARLKPLTVYETLSALLLVFFIAIVVPGLRGLQLRWRLCLALVVLTMVLGVAWCLQEVIHSGRPLTSPFWRRHVLALLGTAEGLVFVSVAGAAALDVAQRASRDWLHFVGVFAALLHSASCVMHWGRISGWWWQQLWLRIAP